MRNLKQGGWGKKAMGAKMRDMTTLKRDNGELTTDPRQIAREATKYYRNLFEDHGEDNIRDDTWIDAICSAEYDL